MGRRRMVAGFGGITLARRVLGEAVISLRSRLRGGDTLLRCRVGKTRAADLSRSQRELSGVSKVDLPLVCLSWNASKMTGVAEHSGRWMVHG